MQDDPVATIVWVVVVLVIVAVVVAAAFPKGNYRGGGSGPGAAAAGAVYDLLNQDKRKAIEIIVEDKAAARDPEDADGNLPDLQNPKPRR